MGKIKWSNEDKNSLIKSFKEPFNVEKEEESLRSKASRERNETVDNLLKRTIPQIRESRRQGLTWTTPEDWDRNFYLLGGGPSRRKSSTILSKIKWEDFLEFCNNQD